MLNRPAQSGVAVLDTSGRRILRRQTVLRTDNDTPVTPQPRDDREQTVETAAHDKPSPVQRKEQRTGPAGGDVLRGPDNRHGEPCPIFANNVGILQFDIGMPDEEPCPDLIKRGTPAWDVLRCHGP